MAVNVAHAPVIGGVRHPNRRPETRDQAISWMAETATRWGWTPRDMEWADWYFSAQIGVPPSSEVADRMRRAR